MDRKVRLTMNDFTVFEGVLRRIDASYYLHLDDCFKFIKPRQLNANFERGGTILYGEMKIYCDDILGVEVKELVPPNKIMTRSTTAKIGLSLPYNSAFCRVNKKFRPVNKAAAVKQQGLTKKEKEKYPGWSNFCDRLISLDLARFLRQNDVALSPTKNFLKAQFGSYKKNASKHYRKRLVSDYLKTVQEMDNLVQNINVGQISRSKG